MDGWIKTLTDDVVWLQPDHPVVTGKSAVRGSTKETFFDPFKIKLDFKFDELEVSGSWAFGRGPFTLELTPKGGGSEIVMRGKFIDVFRRDSGSSWKFARVIWNLDKPLAA